MARGDVTGKLDRGRKIQARADRRKERDKKKNQEECELDEEGSEPARNGKSLELLHLMLDLETVCADNEICCHVRAGREEASEKKERATAIKKQPK